MGLTFTGDSVEATKIIEQRQAAEHVASLKSLLFILASKSDVDVRFSTALGAARVAAEVISCRLRGYRTLGAQGGPKTPASPAKRCRQGSRVEVPAVLDQGCLSVLRLLFVVDL